MPETVGIEPRFPGPLEGQADRRRRQLVDTATCLIETEGVNAVSLSRVAELAHCSRALAYRYFSSSKDLLAAVAERSDEVIADKLDPGEITEVFMTAVDPDGDHAAIRRYLERVFETFEEIGVAGIILANSQFSPELTQHMRGVKKSGAATLRDAADAIGLSETDAGILIEMLIASTYRVVAKWRRGELEREEAIELCLTASIALVRGFVTRSRRDSG
jgi:AcrR family transcriptional regulator